MQHPLQPALNLHQLRLPLAHLPIKHLLKELEDILGVMAIVLIVLIQQHPRRRHPFLQPAAIDQPSIKVDDDPLLNHDLPLLDHPREVLLPVHKDLDLLSLKFLLLHPQTQQQGHRGAEILLVLLF